MQIKITPVGREIKALIVKDGKAYYLVGFAEKVQRWTQGGFIGGSRSRQVDMWQVYFYGPTYGSRMQDPYTYSYGEVSYLDGTRMHDKIKDVFNMYKDDLSSSYKINTLKDFVKQYIHY